MEVSIDSDVGVVQNEGLLLWYVVVKHQIRNNRTIGVVTTLRVNTHGTPQRGFFFFFLKHEGGKKKKKKNTHYRVFLQ